MVNRASSLQRRTLANIKCSHMFSSGDYNHCYIDNSVLSSLYSQLVAQRRMLFLLCGCCQSCTVFSKPLHVAYVDIKAAFDSVDREALWKALRAKHVPPFLISLIKDLHTGTK